MDYLEGLFYFSKSIPIPRKEFLFVFIELCFKYSLTIYFTVKQKLVQTHVGAQIFGGWNFLFVQTPPAAFFPARNKLPATG